MARQKLCICGTIATTQCQAGNTELASRAHKLCDKPLCEDCAIKIGDIVYCAEHAQNPSLFAIGHGEKRKTSRRALDAYYTRRWMIAALIEKCPELLSGVLFDPCCGDGRMIEMLRPYFAAVISSDIDERISATFHGDAADLSVWEKAKEIAAGRKLIVITNPPFTKAGEIARQSRIHAAATALLLRCTWGEPCSGPKRNKATSRTWLVTDPPTGLIMMSRDSFSGNKKTDSAAVWWFIWEEKIRRIMAYMKPQGQKESLL